MTRLATPNEIITVTGPLSADDLGFTLVHEHIFLDLKHIHRSPLMRGYIDDIDVAELELQRYKDAGGVTLVDQTSGGLRENDHDLLIDEDLNQLDVLEQEGVDLRRVVVAHLGDFPRHKYHAEIARRGAYISYDRMGNLKNANPYDKKRALQHIKKIIDAGLINNLIFSHDVCYTSDLHTYGGAGYNFLSTEALPMLKDEIEMTEEQFNTIMLENSRRLLSGKGL